MMSYIFASFPSQVLYKLNLDILDFVIFSELAILDWYSNWHIKNAIFPMNTCFHWNMKRNTDNI